MALKERYRLMDTWERGFLTSPPKVKPSPETLRQKDPVFLVDLWRVASKLTEGVQSLRSPDRAGCLLYSNRFGDFEYD